MYEGLKTAIFITVDQLNIIKESGRGLDSLLPENIEGNYSSEFIYEILYGENRDLMDSIASVYGLDVNIDKDRPVCDTPDTKNLYRARNTTFHAATIGPNTIVIHPMVDESNITNTNSMLMHNLSSMLRAMTEIIPWQQVLKSRTYSQLILAL